MYLFLNNGVLKNNTTSIFFKWQSSMIKRFFPRSLYGRTFLIILLPLIFVQIVTTYVFLDRHLQSVTTLLANAIVSQVSIAKTLYEKYPQSFNEEEKRILSMLSLHINFIAFQKKGSRSEVDEIRRLRHPWADEILEAALQENISIPFQLSTDENNIYISLTLTKGILELSLPHKRLLSKTTSLVLLGTFISSALFLSIALLFMKNQVRPIQRLAEVAEKFGKGQDIGSFRPQGALEIRRAAQAFLQMKERLHRQMIQRMEFLAGISHDLRTPLTRMKLQLALLSSSKDREVLEKDVQDMEYMIQEYLDFVRGEGQETPRKFSLKILTEGVISDLYRKKVNIIFETVSLKKNKDSSFVCVIRPQAIRRVLDNLLMNATKYGEKICIQLKEEKRRFIITIDDDGPGISEEEREKVFRPFYRIDSSRNLETGGVGLGLSIAQDIIQAHGGKIVLERSPLGGLRVIVFLPT